MSIRYIGITGYNLGVLLRILKLSRPIVDIDVVLSYARFTLFNKDLGDYSPQFRDLGAGVVNASPVGMGLLTGCPPPWHPAPDATRQAVAEAAEWAGKKGYTLRKL